ncbi:hypothetical protein [Streptomyces sp. NPDC056682]|uniref:hypothetical protein n=1 Tax=Streptomyces sp. NPDC056682 TaxID=3345909 RepID=UPI00368CC3FA
MVNDGGGKDVKITRLDQIAQGITLTLDELRELGIDSAAGVGRGFTNLELSSMELGYDGLISAFTSFCERWEWGVRALVVEGNNFALAAGLAAGTLYETDQYVQGTMKVGANSLMGNPNASEDDVTKMSWGELAKNNAYAQADFSGKSFDQALANSEQGWLDAGRDVATSQAMAGGIPNPLNLRQAAGVSDAQYEAMLDETFGPSPEERARAAAQQQARPDRSAG